MMVFNYSLPTNITGYADYGIYINSVTDGWFGLVMAVVLFLITFMSVRNMPFKKSLIVSCWVAGIGAMLMWLMGWTNFVVMLLFLIGGALLLIPGGRDE